MEIAKAEMVALEQVISPSNNEVVELAELQLALVGGGVGEVILG